VAQGASSIRTIEHTGRRETPCIKDGRGARRPTYRRCQLVIQRRSGAVSSCTNLERHDEPHATRSRQYDVPNTMQRWRREVRPPRRADPALPPVRGGGPWEMSRGGVPGSATSSSRIHRTRPFGLHARLWRNPRRSPRNHKRKYKESLPYGRGLRVRRLTSFPCVLASRLQRVRGVGASTVRVDPRPVNQRQRSGTS